MGMIVDGQWQKEEVKLADNANGNFVRAASSIRHQISREPDSRFQPEAGRYHLYIAYACPWAHRTAIFRVLKKLEAAISISNMDPYMDEMGWAFVQKKQRTPDPWTGYTYLHELYIANDNNYTGRATVPVLWDKQTQAIVNNESSDIIRMLNSEFQEFTNETHDYYPEDLREKIDEVNNFVYENINNGVYKCGFATSQEAYEESYHKLFDALDKIEELLGKQRYLLGNQLTEADWRLFTTLMRFDSVYYILFKCSKKRIIEYDNITNYLRELYQMPGIADTVKFKQIKHHYYQSMSWLNPNRITPVGPHINFSQRHNRGGF